MVGEFALFSGNLYDVIELSISSIITKNFIFLLPAIVTHAWPDDQTDSLVNSLSNQQNVSTKIKMVDNENNNDCAVTANLIADLFPVFNTSS